MSAILNKNVPFMFSFETTEGKPALDAIAVTTTTLSSDLIKEINVIEKVLGKRMNTLYKALSITDKEKLHTHKLIVIILLTEIFQAHLDRGEDPQKTVEYILTIMDDVWAKLQQKKIKE